MVEYPIKRQPFRTNLFSRISDRESTLRYFFAPSAILIPGAALEWFRRAVSEGRFSRLRMGHVPHGLRSLFSRPPCAAFPGDLPLKTWTGLFLGLSRASCMPGTPPAAPERARGVTSREVSRCNVAPPRCNVIARRPRGGRAA